MQTNKNVVTHAANSICLMLLIGVVHRPYIIWHSLTQTNKFIIAAPGPAVCSKSLLVSRLCLWSTLQATDRKRERHRRQCSRTRQTDRDQFSTSAVNSCLHVVKTLVANLFPCKSRLTSTFACPHHCIGRRVISSRAP